MDYSLSLGQGQVLSSRKSELAKDVSSGYLQSLPGDQLPRTKQENSPEEESTYEFLVRQFQSFFSKPTESEGFTGDYAFKGVEPGVAAANRRTDADMKAALQANQAAVSRYLKADAELAETAGQYVNTNASSSKYRNQFVRTSDKEVAYVTNQGVLKQTGSDHGPVFKSIVGQRGCPTAVQGAPVNDDSFFIGTPMSKNEPCAAAGTNTQVMGASLPGSNPQTWEGQCLNGVSGRFIQQEHLPADVGASPTDIAKSAFGQCHARAADKGASSFYVQKKNQREFPCFISEPGSTFGEIASRGTPATMEVVSNQWVAEKPLPPGTTREQVDAANKVVAGILNDGTITMGTLSGSGGGEFASAVDMASTQDAVRSTVAEGAYSHSKGCDPIKGATIKIKSATLGNNCDGLQFCQLLDQECPPSAKEKFSEEPSAPEHRPPVEIDGYAAVVGDCAGNDLPNSTPDLLPLSTYAVCPAIESSNAGQHINYVDLSRYKIGPTATSSDCSQWDGLIYKDKNLEGKAGTVYMGKLVQNPQRVNTLGACKSACDRDGSCAGFTWYAGPDRPGWNCIPKSASCDKPDSNSQINFYTKTVTKPQGWQKATSVNDGHHLGDAQSRSECFDLCQKAGAQFCAYQCNGCYSGTSLAPRSEASFQSCFQYAVDMSTGTDGSDPCTGCPMEYWRVPKGSGVCPAGNAIRSAAACKAAAADRGLVYNAAGSDYIQAGKFGKGQSKRDYIDCFMFSAGPSGFATWSDSSAADRSSPTNKFGASFSALCQGPAGENPQVMKSYELSRGSVCPPGDQIRSKAQCEAAARKAGVGFGGVVPGSKHHLDCFHTYDVNPNTGKVSNKVWWAEKAASLADRTAPSSYWKYWHAPMCQNSVGK